MWRISISDWRIQTSRHVSVLSDIREKDEDNQDKLNPAVAGYLVHGVLSEALPYNNAVFSIEVNCLCCGETCAMGRSK